MAYAIKKLDGTTEFTLTDAEWGSMQSSINEDGQSTLPNGDDVWIYVMTEDNKDTLLNEVAAEHGADNVAFRVGVLDTI